MGTLGRTTRNGKKAAKARAKAPPGGAARGRKLLGAMQEAESVEQNKAITDILQVISRSPAELQPVFDTILLHAARLCDGSIAVLWQYDAGHLHFAAHRGVSPKGASQLRKNPLALGNYNPTPQAALERRTIHVLDVFADRKYRPLVPRDSLGIRPNAGTVLAVPLLRGDELLGVLSVYRVEKRSFTPKQIEMVNTFAVQAGIAIHNVRLMNETKEALEQQTATSEVLGVISGSATDTQPVFDAIVRSGLKLFPDAAVAVVLPDGQQVRSAAIANLDPAAGEAWKARFPFPLTREYMHGIALLDRRLVDIPDVAANADASLAPGVKNFLASGYRAVTIMPMLRGGAAIGAISVLRLAPGALSDKQTALLKTFADQAVIAIENARLFNETKESLEQQTAISEILRVISSSPADVKPVLDAVAMRAAKICDATDARIFLVDGGRVRHAAGFGDVPTKAPLGAEHVLDRGRVLDRAIMERRLMHIEDFMATPPEEYPVSRELQKHTGLRTLLVVPLLREDRTLGAIILRRTQVRPFTEKQISLVRTFADQAAIAIENVRLFNETKEALDRQKATGEILASISSSITETQPVFDAIVRNLLRLLGTRFAVVQLVRNGQIELVAVQGEPGFERIAEGYPVPVDDHTLSGRAIISGEVQQVSPITGNPTAPPTTVKHARSFGGYEAVICAPMIREGKVIGALSTARRDAIPFDEKQVALIRSFADQAVIAIENARLFNETNEALERQTATAQILEVMSRSQTDVQPVFDTIAVNALNLCDATASIVTRFDGELIHVAAIHNMLPGATEAIRSAFPARPGSRGATSRAILERKVVHIPDVTRDPEYSPTGLAQTANIRSILAVPMLHGGNPVGAIAVSRSQPTIFPDQKIALLKTFADQAVIAIENVRLFNETKESLERQTATAEILQVIGSSPTDTQPVFDSIVNSGVRLFPGAMITVARPDGGTVRAAAIAHEDTTMVAGWRERFTTPLSRDRLHAAAILDAKLIDFPDAEAEKDGPLGPGVRNFLLSGNRAVTIMPMLRGEGAIGAISVTRAVPGPLSDKQIAILRTFADQAVIAIENVRLFKELEARNKDLGESLEQQTSTAEVLKTISRSTFDLRTVLQALVDNAARLSGATRAVMYRPDADDSYRPVVTFNYEPDSPLLARLREHPIRPGRDSIAGRSMLPTCSPTRNTDGRTSPISGATAPCSRFPCCATARRSV
jgi:GAF domain-containing protein